MMGPWGIRDQYNDAALRAISTQSINCLIKSRHAVVKNAPNVTEQSVVGRGKSAQRCERGQRSLRRDGDYHMASDLLSGTRPVKQSWDMLISAHILSLQIDYKLDMFAHSHSNTSVGNMPKIKPNRSRFLNVLLGDTGQNL
jgi:hypothetical protein